MKMKIRIFVLFVFATLLLTACRVVVDTDVKADGSGQLRTAVVFTAKEKEDFEKKPENQGKGICDGIKDGVPADAKFVEEIRDGETYCVTERPFGSLDELRQLYSGMNQVTVNTLKLEMGKVTVDVEVDLTNNNNGGGLENEWNLTLPGGIGENNADRVNAQTLTWVISPGEKAQLHAESMVGTTAPAQDTSGLRVLIAIGLVLLTLIAVLLIILLVRRSRGKTG